ncbi:CDP-diacylglycerol--glycerol-3-phosphate 3-phosphatidyltransferase [Methanolobus vulcani]|uniref:CDP-diacylglycerol--glycerol-3-phosphate 3-phosphatidyltransferase n=1 Tax=Methanolobus vulcani TaxID=38026 RepID=A0A7Z7AVE7_9EURY|nr:archaetidylinositol phosphate synthase [Methanolobus vulcani]MDK2825794.1 CDP-diacylglycerol---glycerol-3-phosphate 3-phosphatidyltransferase [Methanolobus sp.]SDF56064.1 CDP-diacylglycerol--glycerol-3-phosphate 3-phosphatidyltransferase [Methanolobus vulcani]
MTFNALRPVASKILEPMAVAIAKMGISPNTISMISLLFAALAGILYYRSAFDPLLVLVAGLLVALNSFLDAMDGLVARYMNASSARGDFLDHVIDRYSDVFIICGIFFGGYVEWQIGVITIVGVLLTSYLGTQAQALNLGRYYGGIIGRADRLVLIMLSSVIYYFYQAEVFGFSSLGWMILIIGVGSHITAFQRIAHVWKQLE